MEENDKDKPAEEQQDEQSSGTSDTDTGTVDPIVPTDEPGAGSGPPAEPPPDDGSGH